MATLKISYENRVEGVETKILVGESTRSSNKPQPQGIKVQYTRRVYLFVVSGQIRESDEWGFNSKLQRNYIPLNQGNSRRDSSLGS